MEEADFLGFWEKEVIARKKRDLTCPKSEKRILPSLNPWDQKNCVKKICPLTP